MGTDDQCSQGTLNPTLSSHLVIALVFPELPITVPESRIGPSFELIIFSVGSLVIWADVRVGRRLSEHRTPYHQLCSHNNVTMFIWRGRAVLRYGTATFVLGVGAR